MRLDADRPLRIAQAEKISFVAREKRAALIDRKATMPAGDMSAPCLRW
jgi:hypothetical protein